MPGVARVGKGTAGNYVLTSGASTVFVNDAPAAVEKSANAKGATVVSASSSVFADSKKIARERDSLSDGNTIASASINVFAGP
jgi:uncharacterized Zn-binding protein involved in type VI secretion